MERTLRILNLEDNPNDTELIQARLEEEGIACELVRVETEAEYASAVEQGGFDLLLVDYKLPAFDGMSALAISKEKCPDIPFVFVSGSIGEDVAIEALKNGATDYVLKDKLSRLAPAVRRALQEAKERAEGRKAENLLRGLSHRMELILNSAGEGIYGLDMEGKVTFINPAAAGMLGWEQGELLGRNSHETWHHSRPDKTPFPLKECSLLNLLRDGLSRTGYNASFWRRDGTHFPVEYTMTPIYENEILNGAVVIFKDITERVQAQKEKGKLEEQLRQAQKIEAVGTLASGVAHDFNNILSTIIGYAHLTLMKMADDDPLRLNLQQILESADRAATLTQSLLAFSRKQTINPELINVNGMLKRFEKILLRLLREDIELKTVCTAEDLIVMADSGQIEQALMNLVTNARDAMPEGGHLTIETRLIQLDEQFIKMHGYGKEGEYALISVMDTGTGMDKETQVKIFEPFFTTKEPGKGSGLGLAMAYGTIKKHEGFINVYSEEGKGTSFKIYLPIVRGAIEAREKEAAETVPVRGGTETILVAEDDGSLRKLMATVLEHFGYKVIVAVDGEQAVELFIENKDSIQIIILDGIMPKKNGKEAYEEIRALRPDIKAIFVSGYAEDVFTKKGIPQDRVTFLLKPVMPTVLVRNVREVLDRG